MGINITLKNIPEAVYGMGAGGEAVQARSRGIGWRHKKKSADFPDALIVIKATHTARQWRVPMNGVYTFDVAARGISGTTSP